MSLLWSCIQKYWAVWRDENWKYRVVSPAKLVFGFGRNALELTAPYVGNVISMTSRCGFSLLWWDYVLPDFFVNQLPCLSRCGASCEFYDPADRHIDLPKLIVSVLEISDLWRS